MGLLYIWHDNRYSSKILFSTILTPAYDLESKVMEIYVKFGVKVYKISQFLNPCIMLKFSVKVYKISQFLNPCMDLLYIWHDHRYWSKILFSTISYLKIRDLEVKVTDSEILS